MPEAEILGEKIIDDIEDLMNSGHAASPRDKVRKHVMPKVKSKVRQVKDTQQQEVVKPDAQSIIPGMTNRLHWNQGHNVSW